MQALGSFKAESDFELNLSVGDIVIVRKVATFYYFHNFVLHASPKLVIPSCGIAAYLNLMLSCPTSDIKQWLGGRRMQGESWMVPT
jgi:hypothetical protein